MNDNQCIRVYADLAQINGCRKRIKDVNYEIKKLSEVLNLAGNQVRLSILFLLNEEQKLCVCDLSDILNMTIPAVSQHLRKMKDGGIVYNNKVGQTIFYSLTREYDKLFKPFFKLIENKESLAAVI